MNFSLHVSDSRCKNRLPRLRASTCFPHLQSPGDVFAEHTPCRQPRCLAVLSAAAEPLWSCCSSPAPDPYLAARCQAASEIKGKKAWQMLQNTAPRGKACAQTQIPAQQPACLAPSEPSLALSCVVLSSPAPATLSREHPALEGRVFDGKACALPSLLASRPQQAIFGWKRGCSDMSVFCRLRHEPCKTHQELKW